MVALLKRLAKTLVRTEGPANPIGTLPRKGIGPGSWITVPGSRGRSKTGCGRSDVASNPTEEDETVPLLIRVSRARHHTWVCSERAGVRADGHDW